MKYTYEKIVNAFGEDLVIRSDGANIPCNVSNSDYQRYLRWLENPDAEEGGTL